jgi:error-prone DNA polymerase
MAAAARYAELHAWSNFTFLEGSSHPEELVAAGVAAGLAGLALTDRDGLYGAVRFAKAAKEHKLPAICGVELTLETPAMEPSRPARAAHEVPTHTPRIVLLVQDARGYANLCELISLAQLRGRKRDARTRLEDFSGRSDGLIALSGGANGLIEHALRARDDDGAFAIGARLRDLFPAASISNCSITYGPRTARSCKRWCSWRSASACRMSRPTAWPTSIARMRSCATC